MVPVLGLDRTYGTLPAPAALSGSDELRRCNSPAAIAGLGLAGFSSALLTMWWRTPGMHEPGSLRPTHQGTAIAKDVWMLGIGTGLVVDAATGAVEGQRRRLTPVPRRPGFRSNQG